MPRRSPPEVRERVWACRKQGWSLDRIAHETGLNRDTVRSILGRHRPGGVQGQEAARAAQEATQTAVQQERARAIRDAQAAELRRLTARRAVIEEWRDAIHQAALTVTPPGLVALPAQAPFGEEEAVLLLGDVHLGQATPPRLTAGWTQDTETTEGQVRVLGEALLRLWELQAGAAPWRTLHLLCLGDLVEGSGMRTSQARQVDLLAVQQAGAAGRAVASLVLTALQRFEHVTLDAVPGNHGRTSQQAGPAGLAELDPADSFDWLAIEFAGEILRAAVEAGRVEIRNHQQYYGTLEVAGHRVVLEHGSSLRGGSSWGGIPYYGVDRTSAAYRDLLGDYTVLALGHFHRPYELPSAYGGMVVGNGAFPPTTPFTVATRHQATRPSQTLLSIHPRRGVTMIRRLYLDTPREGPAPPA